MFLAYRLLVFLLVVVVFTTSQPLCAGTLNSARGKTRSNSKSKTGDRRDREDEAKENERDEDDDESVASGILSSVVKQALKREPRQEKPDRKRRERRQHHGRNHHGRHHHPSRSPGSLGIHFSSVPIGPMPVVVEEHHHFYGPPVEVIPSPGDIAPPVRLPPAPMMEASVPVPHLAPPPMEIHDPWHIRFAMEYGSDSDDLSQFGFDLLANHTAGLGIDTSVRMHREQGYDFRDHLWIGDFNIVYELFPTERIRPRAGIGVNWLADNIGGEAGLNLTLGVDVSLWERIKLTGEVDYGTLGDADFLHSRATLGYGISDHVEWFAGYDHLDIGGVKIDGVVTGIRFRF